MVIANVKFHKIIVLWRRTIVFLLGQDILAKEKEAYFRNGGYVLNSAGQWTPDFKQKPLVL